MSLSSTLQDAEVLGLVARRDSAALRAAILAKGARWCAEHADEAAVVRANLSAFGFAASDGMIEAVQRHLLLHYYEKLLALAHTPAGFRDYLSGRVSAAEGLGALAAARQAGRVPLVAICHFGAVELVPPLLAANGYAVNAALRFATPAFAQAAHAKAAELSSSGSFASIRLIEIGTGASAAALDMAAALRRGEILLSTFDEHTNYSKPVLLRGMRVMGGAGIDRILRFANVPCSLMAAFMARTGDDRYEFVVREVPPDHADPVQCLYDHLQTMIDRHPEQWYFLHEEIPLADGPAR